jgi:hypothetical protein
VKTQYIFECQFVLAHTKPKYEYTICSFVFKKNLCSKNSSGQNGVGSSGAVGQEEGRGESGGGLSVGCSAGGIPILHSARRAQGAWPVRGPPRRRQRASSPPPRLTPRELDRRSRGMRVSASAPRSRAVLPRPCQRFV